MQNINKEEFGKFITTLRKEKELTQKELAELLHVSDKAVSKWERGVSMPDISLLMPLSHIFNVSVTELLNGERLSEGSALSVKQVDNLLKKTINLSSNKLKLREILKQKEDIKKTAIRVFMLNLICFVSVVLVFAFVMLPLNGVFTELIPINTAGPIASIIAFLCLALITCLTFGSLFLTYKKSVYYAFAILHFSVASIFVVFFENFLGRLTDLETAISQLNSLLAIYIISALFCFVLAIVAVIMYNKRTNLN